MTFRLVEKCPVLYGIDGPYCEQELGHDDEHYYTVWQAGTPCYPGCDGLCEFECLLPRPSYPVYWGGKA